MVTQRTYSLSENTQAYYWINMTIKNKFLALRQNSLRSKGDCRLTRCAPRNDYFLPLVMLTISMAVLLLPIDAFASNGSIASEIDEIFTKGSLTGRVMQIFMLISVLGIAPAILVMVTPFVRITIVLSMLRSALGLQQSPPNQVMVSLALFLTFFIIFY